MTEQEKEQYMALALHISRQALPSCRPNPPVGCVMVKGGTVVATGFTRPPGGEHAEAAALRRFGSGTLEDVSVFVTLEPCSFAGRTPSCALALIGRGARRIFVSVVDPHPRNRGQGLRLLQEAGAVVEVGILADRVMAFIGPYLTCE